MSSKEIASKSSGDGETAYGMHGSKLMWVLISGVRLWNLAC
jgi:hypothetical protein